MKKIIALFILVVSLLTSCQPGNPRSAPASPAAVDFYFLQEPGRSTELYGWNQTWSQVSQLTMTEGMVLDYDVNPTTRDLIVSVQNSLQGADLWLYPSNAQQAYLLVECQARTCAGLNISPDGKILAYQSSDFAYDSAAFEMNAVNYFLALDDTIDQTMNVQQGLTGMNFQWARDGKSFALFDSSLPGIRIMEISGLERLAVKGTNISHIFGWGADPNSFFFLLEDVSLEQSVSILQNVAIEEKKFERLKINLQDSDIITRLKASPDGLSLLINVRTSAFFPGQKLYIYDLISGLITHQLESPDKSLGNFEWSQNSNEIIMQQYAFNQNEANPEIVIWDLETEKVTPQISNAILPKFSPDY